MNKIKYGIYNYNHNALVFITNDNYFNRFKKKRILVVSIKTIHNVTLIFSSQIKQKKWEWLNDPRIFFLIFFQELYKQWIFVILSTMNKKKKILNEAFVF